MKLQLKPADCRPLVVTTRHYVIDDVDKGQVSLDDI